MTRRRDFLKKNVKIIPYSYDMYRVIYGERSVVVTTLEIEGVLTGLCLASGVGLTKWHPSDIRLGKKSLWDGLLQCKVSWGR